MQLRNRANFNSYQIKTNRKKNKEIKDNPKSPC